MKIGIELRQPILGESGGIALLLKGVLETLFACHPEHQFLVFCTAYNSDLLAPAMPNVSTIRLPTLSFFARLDAIAQWERLDVLFRSYPMEDSLQFPQDRQVFLLPDLQHELLPSMFLPETLRARRLAFNRALSTAGAIGTLSEHARQTLVEHSWTRCTDIFLMRPGLVRPAEVKLSSAEQDMIPRGDYFLYPANLWPHKNHRRVMQAFQGFLSRSGRPFELILTGHPNGWPALRAEFDSLPVRHLGFVSPGLLHALFRSARALVFFSLFEGFGMPLLEAFAAGIPVICSDTTSLPEVGGDAVLTCDPTDIDAISALMARVVGDDDLRATLIERGHQRLSQFTWAESADALNTAFERVAAHSRIPYQLAQPAEQPLVSIITPSYNQGHFLQRTIESVLGQTYPRIEYIVVDGGSSDETLAILQSYGDRFQWLSEPDQGQTDAINKGFARARGSICAYLNSDDVLLPEAVAIVVQYLNEHPDCDLVYGRALHIDAQDHIIGQYRTEEYSFARLVSENCICQPATFWRQRIVEKVGVFDTRLHYAMDYEYWMRIDRAGGRIAHIHDVLAASRLYAQTKTQSARGEIFREIFQISMQHAGYIDRPYFFARWHYWVYEQPSGGLRYLRHVPKSVAIVARLNYWWYHRRRYTPRYSVRMLIKRMKRHERIVRLYSWAEPHWVGVHRRLDRLKLARASWATSVVRRLRSRSSVT